VLRDRQQKVGLEIIPALMMANNIVHNCVSFGVIFTLNYAHLHPREDALLYVSAAYGICLNADKFLEETVQRGNVAKTHEDLQADGRHTCIAVSCHHPRRVIDLSSQISGMLLIIILLNDFHLFMWQLLHRRWSFYRTVSNKLK